MSGRSDLESTNSKPDQHLVSRGTGDTLSRAPEGAIEPMEEGSTRVGLAPRGAPELTPRVWPIRPVRGREAIGVKGIRAEVDIGLFLALCMFAE